MVTVNPVKQNAAEDHSGGNEDCGKPVVVFRAQDAEQEQAQYQDQGLNQPGQERFQRVTADCPEISGMLVAFQLEIMKKKFSIEEKNQIVLLYLIVLVKSEDFT